MPFIFSHRTRKERNGKLERNIPLLRMNQTDNFHIYWECHSIQCHAVVSIFNIVYHSKSAAECSAFLSLSPRESANVRYIFGVSVCVCVFAFGISIFSFVFFPSAISTAPNPLHLAIAFIIELIYTLHSGWFTTGFQSYVHRLFLWFSSGFAYHHDATSVFSYSFSFSFYLDAMRCVWVYCDILLFYCDTTRVSCRQPCCTHQSATCLFPCLSWLWLLLSWSYLFMSIAIVLFTLVLFPMGLMLQNRSRMPKTRAWSRIGFVFVTSSFLLLLLLPPSHSHGTPHVTKYMCQSLILDVYTCV